MAHIAEPHAQKLRSRRLTAMTGKADEGDRRLARPVLARTTGGAERCVHRSLDMTLHELARRSHVKDPEGAFPLLRHIVQLGRSELLEALGMAKKAKRSYSSPA
jgi:hypothetical protein